VYPITFYYVDISNIETVHRNTSIMCQTTKKDRKMLFDGLWDSQWR